eukprot:6157001-Amphidinium_carterae.1
MGEKHFWPLRDLQLAQAVQAALRTHSVVVAVVGRDHLDGIAKLLLQDPDIYLVDQIGHELRPPTWMEDLRQDGKAWEEEAMVPNSLFSRLAEATDLGSLGTFLSQAAASELLAMRDDSARQLQAR